MKITLDDRELWADGVVSYDPTSVLKYAQYNPRHVTKITDEIRQYNKFTLSPLTIKTELNEIEIASTIPTRYTFDVFVEVVGRLHEVRFQNDQDYDARCARLALELSLVQDRNLTSLFVEVLYIIQELTTTGNVWGVGRGSSVACYTLFVIGLHNVDSWMHEIDMYEFFK